MKVVFISRDDWANLTYTYSECLNEVGVYAKAFSINKHGFNYPKTAEQFTKDSIHEIENADVVIFGHSRFVQTGVNLSKKIVGVIHGGSTYRQNPNGINRIFDPIVDVTFCQIDLLGRGPKNEVCIPAAIDTDSLKPVYSDFFNRRQYIIGHYPTNPKGYETIRSVINNLQRDKRFSFEFRYDPRTVPFDEHIKRVSKCDIYIEDMSTHQKGIPLEGFGITTLECACLGKIICTRFPRLSTYEKLFGKCGIQVTNTGEDLERKLRSLTSIPDIDFINIQKETRKWVEERHSYKVIGTWLKNQFEMVKKS